MKHLLDHIGMKLEISCKWKTQKYKNIWRLNNMLLNNQRFKEEVKKYLETNETGKTTDQSIWDAAKAVLRGKFITIHS